MAGLEIKFWKVIPGGAKRNRTVDLLNAIQALYQLSYGPQGEVDVDPIEKARNPFPARSRIARLQRETA